MSKGKLSNKTLSGYKILETLLALAAEQCPDLGIGNIRDFEWNDYSDNPEVTTIRVHENNVGNYWKIEANIYVENDPPSHDYRDGMAHFWLRTGEDHLVFPFDCHYFIGKCHQFGLGQKGYKIAFFEKKPAMVFGMLADTYGMPGIESFEEAFGVLWVNGQGRRPDSVIYGTNVLSRHQMYLDGSDAVEFADRIGLLRNGNLTKLPGPLSDAVIRTAKWHK